MSYNNNSTNSTISSIMMGSRRSSSGGTNNNNNNGEGENMLISILCLFASDLIAGVGLKSFLRTFLRSHIPLIEFSIGIELNVPQQLEQHPEQHQIRLSLLDHGFPHESTQESTEFIIEIKGLKNRGQTCYANSVVQALASIQPLCTYLNALQQQSDHTHNTNCNGQGQDSVALALYQTIQYVNGHKVPRTKWRRTKSSFLPRLSTLFSSSYYTPGDPQRVMDLVAKHHSQFRSRNGMGAAGTLEQQDSHEFFSALMDVLSLEEQRMGDGENMQTKHSSDTNTNRGLSCSSNSFLRSGETVGDIISNDDDEFKESKDNATDIYEEEKKHDDIMNSDQNAFSESMAKEDNKLDAQQSQPTAIRAATTSSKSTIQNPFDGWSGSTIKCASCCHIRPIRSTPFLGLSLPIANIQSEFLEDFLSAEYGGFATAERVEDVQCFSCAIGQKVDELEEEDMLLNGAISSKQKRKRGKKATQNGNDNSTYGDDIAGLVEESQQIKRKIAILKALDPDADDDKLECTDEKDAQQEIELGINSSLPPISPLRGDAYKASLLMRPPQVLCIHIQRRHYEISCNRMVKVMRHVHFDEVLDLGAYCAYGENSFEKQRTFSTTTSRSCEARIPYKLMSVIEHQGNAFGGHYQTYRRFDPNQNDWAVVSDESIAFRTWNDVKRCQAYMLFYVAMPST